MEVKHGSSRRPFQPGHKYSACWVSSELLSQQLSPFHLQKYKVLCIPAESEEPPCIDVHPYFSLMILRKALTELRERMNDVCERELSRISDLSEFLHIKLKLCEIQ